MDATLYVFHTAGINIEDGKGKGGELRFERPKNNQPTALDIPAPIMRTLLAAGYLSVAAPAPAAPAAKRSK